jgi:cytochrome c-type biogenesis protein CcmH
LTTFVLACAALVALSGLFYLLPGRRQGGADEDLARANIEWFRLREAELAKEGGDVLQEDARLRLLEDEQQTVAPPQRSGSQSFPVWILLPLLEALDEAGTPAQMQTLMGDIEARAAQRPGNLDYVALLGRYYMGQEDYAQAEETYGDLVREAPEDAHALAYAAQAAYLAAGRQLSSQARLRAEQALAIDPHQRTALGLLGMASFEQQQYQAAITYWQRLLASEPAGSEGANMISGVIEAARQRLAAAGGQLPAGDIVSAAGPAESGEPTPGVTVRVALPEGASLAASDTVFVLARNAASDSRMPIAVQRLQAGQLPVTLRLDDSNSMAGQKLSATESVLVVVQVSPDGRPGEATATWLGQAGPLAPTLDLAPRDILLQPKS